MENLDSLNSKIIIILITIGKYSQKMFLEQILLHRFITLILSVTWIKLHVRAFFDHQPAEAEIKNTKV